MKRTICLVTLATVPFIAQADPRGGFTGPDGRRPPITVVEALALPEDSQVTLVGYILRSLGDELYEFRDDTGTLVAEIDDDEWDGLEVTPNDQVELSGEIDHEGRDIGVDVESVRLAQAAQ